MLTFQLFGSISANIFLEKLFMCSLINGQVEF